MLHSTQGSAGVLRIIQILKGQSGKTQVNYLSISSDSNQYLTRDAISLTGFVTQCAVVIHR